MRKNVSHSLFFAFIVLALLGTLLPYSSFAVKANPGEYTLQNGAYWMKWSYNSNFQSFAQCGVYDVYAIGNKIIVYDTSLNLETSVTLTGTYVVVWSKVVTYNSTHVVVIAGEDFYSSTHPIKEYLIKLSTLTVTGWEVNMPVPGGDNARDGVIYKDAVDGHLYALLTCPGYIALFSLQPTASFVQIGSTYTSSPSLQSPMVLVNSTVQHTFYVIGTDSTQTSRGLILKVKTDGTITNIAGSGSDNTWGYYRETNPLSTNYGWYVGFLGSMVANESATSSHYYMFYSAPSGSANYTLGFYVWRFNDTSSQVVSVTDTGLDTSIKTHRPVLWYITGLYSNFAVGNNTFYVRFVGASMQYWDALYTVNGVGHGTLTVVDGYLLGNHFIQVGGSDAGGGWNAHYSTSSQVGGFWNVKYAGAWIEIDYAGNKVYMSVFWNRTSTSYYALLYTLTPSPIASPFGAFFWELGNNVTYHYKGIIVGGTVPNGYARIFWDGVEWAGKSPVLISNGNFTFNFIPNVNGGHNLTLEMYKIQSSITTSILNHTYTFYVIYAGAGGGGGQTTSTYNYGSDMGTAFFTGVSNAGNFMYIFACFAIALFVGVKTKSNFMAYLGFLVGLILGNVVGFIPLWVMAFVMVMGIVGLTFLGRINAGTDVEGGG